MRIITVSREFGSGGRELGKRLADQLNVAYYDKEIIGKIAQKVQMDAHYIENVLERGYTQHYPYTFRRSFAFVPKPPSAYSTLLVEQTKLIRELAAKEDCIIVGRGANVLLQREKSFHLFVYADMPAKIARCRERAPEDEHLSDQKLEQMIKRIDKDRAATYSLISGRVWGIGGTTIFASIPRICRFPPSSRMWPSTPSYGSSRQRRRITARDRKGLRAYYTQSAGNERIARRLPPQRGKPGCFAGRLGVVRQFPHCLAGSTPAAHHGRRHPGATPAALAYWTAGVGPPLSPHGGRGEIGRMFGLLHHI